ncbi:MAG: ATP-binding protein, partial [Planctomycetota bacterium]
MSHEWVWTIETTLPSRRGAHLPLMEEILQQLSGLGWEGRDYFGVQMALEESLSNAIRHGNNCDESKVVQVECKVHANRFWISVEDEGEGFQPAEVADCTTEEGLEATGGRGMML